VRFHTGHDALATLAVQQRETSRPLLFNEQDQLCGRRVGRDSQTEWALPAQPVRSLAFSGIHVVSPRIFSELSEEGAFSIVPAYLRLAAQGEAILAFNAESFYWRDLGRPEDLAQAERDLASGVYSAT
jgi:NDP-sugar pyrophosphorylase family protein